MAGNAFTGSSGHIAGSLLDPYGVGTNGSPDPMLSQGSGVSNSNSTLENNLQGQIYSDPHAALNLWLSQMGFGAGNVNSPFYNFLDKLAPGAQFLGMFTDPNAFGPNGATSVLGDINAYFNQGLNGGGNTLGSAASALHTLLSGGAPDSSMAGFIDAMSANDIMSAVEQMAIAGAQGGYGPWAMKGIDTNAANLMNQWQAAMGGALATGASEAAAFRNWLQNQGSGFLGSLGIGF